MGFPDTPLDVVTELFIGGTWRDVSGDVLLRDGIRITRGRADEASQVDPSTCALSIRNTDGVYSPRNPTSPFYGTFGRNTPLRLSVRTVVDGFGRTVPAGWGSTPDGLVWDELGGGGSVVIGDFSVDGTSGIHTVPAAPAFRATHLEAGPFYRDCEVAVSFRLDVAPTGAGLEPATIMLRGQDLTTYYRARVTVGTDLAIGLAILDPDQQIISQTDLSLVYAVGARWRVRAQVEGPAIRMRVWDTAGPEPRGWQLVAVDPAPLMAAGWVGVRSGVATGNTNPTPVRFSYDDFQVTVPRFAGEVSSWPPRWDVSGADVWVPITASGIGRRLGQGASPLRSALYREMTSPTNQFFIVAYWPCEDGSTATQIASASPAAPMRLSATGVAMSSSTVVPGSEGLPVLSAGGSLSGDIPQSPDGGVFARAVIVWPETAKIPDGATVWSISTTGSARRWDLVYHTVGAGSLSLHAFNADGVEMHATGPISFGVDGRAAKLEVELTQNGSATDSLMVVRFIRPDGLGVDSFTWAESFGTMTVGHASRVVVGPARNLDDLAVGHIGLGTDQSFGFNMSEALVGNAGELAGLRAGRLASEEQVPTLFVGALADTEAMGAQHTKSLLDLLRECADSDGGVLYEARADLALALRTRTSVYNQAPVLALDYTIDGQVAPPLEPVDDDQHLRNSVTVQRDGGSSARVTVDTGPLSTQPPPDGVGTYDEQVTLSLARDVQALNQAAWRVHLGTWDEARYPTVHVDLAAGPDLIPAASAVDIRDRVTIDNLPPWLPPGGADLLVEGYTETLGAYDWDLVFNASPAGPWTVGVLEDPVLGRADTDGSELAADIGAADTTITVTVTDGPLWITGSASPDFPVDILVGGEVMTVTAISGAASPQTFTVTRGTNGVALAHAAGTGLSLAQPMRLAL